MDNDVATPPDAASIATSLAQLAELCLTAARSAEQLNEALEQLGAIARTVEEVLAAARADR